MKSIILLLTLCLLFSCLHALQFSIRQGEETCLSKEVRGGDYVSGTYTSSPDTAPLNVTIKDSIGDLVYNKQGVIDGVFAYTAPQSGSYNICFSNVSALLKNVKLTVETSLQSNPSQVAKKTNIKPLEAQMKHLQSMVASIAKDETWLAEKQRHMRTFHSNTVYYAMLFNILLLVIVCAGYFFQLWYLKSYFKAKKLFLE